jgi:hypothetical protein
VRLSPVPGSQVEDNGDRKTIRAYVMNEFGQKGQGTACGTARGVT